MSKKLKALLADAPSGRWHGGAACTTCKHPKAKDIAADFAEFARSKSAGHPMPWSAFYKYLREEYGMTTCDTSLARHHQRCGK